MINPKTPFIYYGGDYNPDQWDEATIDRDMELFKKANVNLVTLPVFAWAKLEPREGVYNFDWLDAILEKLWKNGIHVCLATPTSAQPAWLSMQYPEVLPVDIQGRKRRHGMRVFFCPNSSKYRERAAALAEQMAKRYQSFPGLAVWHIANEYGTYCYCDTCQNKFRQWLKKHYGTPENLNDKWNLSFWGRTVYSFDEITLPSELNDDYRFYPQMQLDYMKFMTDSVVECFLNESEVIKKYTPNIPVMTNMSGYIKKLDQFEMLKHMDVAGWDNYPSPLDDKSLVALKHDIVRGLKGGQSYILTEQSPNQQNWQPYNRLKRPGEVRMLTYQALAHGADSCLFFQMRQSVSGMEKFHGAVVSHSGREDTRVFKECCRLGGELKAMGGEFLGGRAKAEVGVLFDWNNWWAVELSSGPSKDLAYLEQVQKYYRPFFEKNVAVDILSTESDLSGYKIIVAPLLYMVKEGVTQKIEEFVKNGGTFIASVFSGIVGENDKVELGGYPGKLKNVLGIWVEECDALLPGQSNNMAVEAQAAKEFGLKSGYSCGLLCDVIHPEGAKGLAFYTEDFYRGAACLTENRFGKGTAYYVGTDPQPEFLSDFAESILKKAGVAPVLRTPEGVEAAKRYSENGEFTFVINHNGEPARVSLGEEKFMNLVTGEPVRGGVTLQPLDAVILKKQ